MAGIAARGGKVRYSILAMLFFVSIINYADRSILAIAAPLLSKDLQIDPLELGIVFSGFGWAYVIAQLPGGWALDRFGTKRVYLVGITLWSIFTAAQGTVLAFGASAAVSILFALRFLVGFAEGPSFPGNARLVAAWFPAAERGTASAIFNASQYFATVLFAPIMGWITFTFGWPYTFYFMGALGLVASLIWTVTIYSPRTHPRVTEAEIDFVAAGGALVDMDRGTVARPPAVPGEMAANLRVLLSNRTLWGLYIGQFAINTLTYFFITWFPVYLVQERGMNVLKAGLFASAPAICGFLGGVLGGIWSDWLLRRGHSLTVARKVPVVSGMLVSLTIVACNYVDVNSLVLLFMSIAFFGKGIGALGWAVVADVAPRKVAGLSGGLFNMFGNLSSILTPIVIGGLLKATGSFKLALVFVACNALLAAFSYLFIAGRIERIEEGEPSGSGAPAARAAAAA
ncbi:MFS transporter [Sphingomonas sp. AP4-R1]|uniref:MFS transporter n=1 Tax=Sphingomonas sp. AP4-R1 TaxID=2735134 RepID=UPI0014935241|nr:MFS transporter [Sphingomonas sp. AP4-R1]QJU59823.1 MFS transporter [Sphingomonas sp. AP4-R1]